MSEYSYIRPMCDSHQDEVAQVLCRHHKELLCLSCVLKRAESQECSLTEIGHVSGENDSLLLECLVVRQMSVEKKQLIDNYESKTESIKSDLEQQVIEMHSKLTKRLEEMKDDCLKSIETQARAVTETNEYNKQRLVTLGITVNEFLDKMSDNSADDINDIQSNLMELKTELMEKIPDKDTEPDGSFHPNKQLGEFILQECTFLGRVYVIDTARYDEIDDCSENISDTQKQETLQSPHLNESELTSNETNEVSVVTHERLSESIYTASDEIAYDIEKETHVPAKPCLNDKTADCTGSCTKKQADSTETEQSGESADEGKPGDKKSCEAKPGRTFGGLFKRLLSDTKRFNRSDGKQIEGDATETDCPSENNLVSGKKTENVSDRTTALSSYVHPSDLKNRTVVMSELEKQFSSACKFSKLVHLGDGLVGLLSKVHNTFVLADLLGNVHSTKTMIAGLIDAVATGNAEVALLADNGQQICKFDASFNGLSTAEYFVVNEEIPNITGFEFDITSSHFAISSPNKLVVLDKNGRKIKSVQYSSALAPLTQMATVYDFKKDCLYILNIQNRTLKCFSFETSNVLWRCKYEGNSFTPRSMCLYTDTICIACRGEIELLLAEDGSLAAQRHTRWLLDDCLGVCVIDGVVVYTSNSDDFEKSTKLAYISI